MTLSCLSFSLGQDEELLKSIQATVVRVEGDCEQLSYITGSLRDDHHQHQKDIEVGGWTPRGSEHPPGTLRVETARGLIPFPPARSPLLVQMTFPKEQGALAGQNTALTLLWCHEMLSVLEGSVPVPGES